MQERFSRNNKTEPAPENGVYRYIAYGLSFLLHPLLMPSIIFLVIAAFSPRVLNPLSEPGRRFLLGFIFTSTFVFPFIVTALYGKLSHKKLSLNYFFIENAKDRVVPFLFTGIIYTGTTYLLHTSLKMNSFIVIIMTGISVSVLVTGVISNFWKISAHAVGISGATGFLFMLNYLYPEDSLFYVIVVLILLSGALLSARLYLNAHTPLQIFAGYCIGLFVSIGSVFLFIY
jgi:membrane-associated phospholipid phosphatase